MPLDSYFKATISNYEPIDKIPDAKYYYCVVEILFEENVLDFVKKNKVEYLFILGGGNPNFDELKKCDDLKFVFDKTNK